VRQLETTHTSDEHGMAILNRRKRGEAGVGGKGARETNFGLQRAATTAHRPAAAAATGARVSLGGGKCGRSPPKSQGGDTGEGEKP
jgi:hypothetical protein